MYPLALVRGLAWQLLVMLPFIANLQRFLIGQMVMMKNALMISSAIWKFPDNPRSFH